MFTEHEANVVLSILLRRLFELKETNDDKYNDLIEIIESATNKLDELIITQGYSNV